MRRAPGACGCSAEVLGYVIKRLLVSLPTLVLVAASVFFLMRLIPGDPATVILGDAATPDAVADLRVAYGLDRPVLMQFALWVERAAEGGSRPFHHQWRGRWAADPATLPGDSGHRLRLRRHRRADRGAAGDAGGLEAEFLGDVAAVATATFLLSIPSFWLGLIFLLVFGLWLGWVPVVGYVTFAEDFWGRCTTSHCLSPHWR